MSKIDIDRFISDLIEYGCSPYGEKDYLLALQQQALDFQDGELVEMEEIIGKEENVSPISSLTDEQRAYIEEGLKNGSMIREKDLAYAEPKFKIGDWLVNKKQVGEAFCITQIDKPHYYSTNLGSFIKFGEEENYRKWTIKDAKAGDILAAENGWTCIFREVGDFDFASYCFMEASCCFFPEGGKCHTLDSKYGGKMYPATKEQREKFEEVMNNAGYTWNQEELKLEKKRLFSTIRFDEPRTKDELIELRDEKGEKVLVSKKKFLERVNEIGNEEDDYIWPKDIIDQMHNEIAAGTPKVEAELKKYFANFFPYLYNVDVDKMVEEYKEEESKVLLPLGFSKGNIEHLSIAYKNGIEDMLKLIKEGGEE